MSPADPAKELRAALKQAAALGEPDPNLAAEATIDGLSAAAIRYLAARAWSAEVRMYWQHLRNRPRRRGGATTAVSPLVRAYSASGLLQPRWAYLGTYTVMQVRSLRVDYERRAGENAEMARRFGLLERAMINQDAATVADLDAMVITGILDDPMPQAPAESKKKPGRRAA